VTGIEWTDRTWNPVTGCTKVSPGCDRCYAEGIARRFAGSKAFPNGFDVTLHAERLAAPLRWRKPARVFVNSMSDLFHDAVPDEFIARVWAVMAATPQHTYQVLTKRHGRMRSLLNSGEFSMVQVADEAIEGLGLDGIPWPLPNVWLGVSAEDQRRAELRIPALLDTPAAVRFLSCEPLLGPLDLSPWLKHVQRACERCNPGGPRDWQSGHLWGRCVCACHPERPPRPDWVIVGGETGPGARRMELGWAASLVDLCRIAGVPVFVKQLGSAHGPHKGSDMNTWPADLRVREWPEVRA
jgi:protein gp37